MYSVKYLFSIYLPGAGRNIRIQGIILCGPRRFLKTLEATTAATHSP